MKRNVILLVDADTETCAAALTAAQTLGFDVRFAQIRRDLSEITQFGLDDVAVIVLDYDPDLHGSTIAELIDQWQSPRPVVFISSDAGTNHSLPLLGGSARHLTKPVTAARLAHAVEMVVAKAKTAVLCCDRWGHPCEHACHSSGAKRPEKIAA